MSMKQFTVTKTGMAALALSFIMLLTLAGCSMDSGGDSGSGAGPTGATEVALDKLEGYITGLPANTKDKPYTIKLARTTIDISGSEPTPSSQNARLTVNVDIGTLSNMISGKFVILDLSACTAKDNTVRGFRHYIGNNDGSTPQSTDMNSIWNNTSIVGVILPNSLTTIGDYAFYYCQWLTSVTIPDGVTSIGNGAFYRCLALTGITIPPSVATIGDGAFEEAGLESLIIPDTVTTIGEKSFYYLQELRSLTISSGITDIPDGAFYNCFRVEGDLIIPEGVQTIGEEAFGAWSYYVTNIIIPNTVTSIGNWAFSSCSAPSVTIPASVTSLGNRAFHSDKLFEVTFAAGSNISADNFDYNAFYGGASGVRAEYLAGEGGPGTYTRTEPGTTWAKQ